MTARYSTTIMRPFAPLLQRTRSYVQAFNAQSITPLIALPAPSSLLANDCSHMNPRQIRKHLDSIVIGQDTLKKALSVAIYNHYIRIDSLHSALDTMTKSFTNVNSSPQQHFHSSNSSSTSLSTTNHTTNLPIPHSIQSTAPIPIGNIPTTTTHSNSRENINDHPVSKSSMTQRNRQHAHREPPTTIIEKSNILLVGPTGSGKTLISKATAQFLNVPFSMNDATPLTQAGYVGDDVESCIYRLLQNADFDVAKAQRGIVFIDEIDKIARRSDASNPNQRDVSGEGVQQGLLRILEGTVVNVTVKPGAGRRGSNMSEVYSVDTSNILFICSGAFVGLDKIVANRTSVQKSIGFDAPMPTPFMNGSTSSHPIDSETSTQEPKDFLTQCEPEDLVKFGFIPEFVGRLPVIATATHLTAQELVRILTEPKNAIVSQYEALFKASNIDLRFTQHALMRIAQEALVKKTGARGLRRIIETLLQDALYEYPGTEVAYVVVHVDPNTSGNRVNVSGFEHRQVNQANTLLDDHQHRFGMNPYSAHKYNHHLSQHGYRINNRVSK